MIQKIFALVVFFLLSITAVAETVESATRAVLEQNFQACTAENIEALMDTQARGLPKCEMDNFRKAAEELFAETDVYLRLEEFEITQVQLPFAAARVVQLTQPGDETVRQNPDEAERFYRNHTMLLPQYERVEYVQTFKRENGKWRLWEIVTEPQPVGDVGEQQQQVAAPTCRDGNCNLQPASGAVFQ